MRVVLKGLEMVRSLSIVLRSLCDAIRGVVLLIEGRRPSCRNFRGREMYRRKELGLGFEWRFGVVALN